MSDFFTNIKDSLVSSWENLKELNLLENFKEILGQPLGLVALGALIVIMIVLVRARKIKFTTKLMAQVGLMLALTVVLDIFKIYTMPQGGSVTLGSMIPIILLSLWFGAEVGMLAGLLYGILSLILGAYVVHPVQLLLDYPLAYLAVGAAGFLRTNKFAAASVGISLRFICHVLSGVIFFSSYAAEAGYSSPLLYSIVYNGTFLGVDAIICVLILAILPVERLARTAQSA